LAKSFADKLYPEGVDDEEYDPADVAYHAGLFVYGCELYGLTFERVAEHAGPYAAQVVRALSHDNRLLPAEREQQQRDAIRKGGPLHQAVKLAEILASTREALRMPEQQVLDNRVDLRRWHVHQVRIVTLCMPDIKDQPCVSEPLYAASVMLDKLGARLLQILGKPYAN
jgi:hypothetical protein